MRPYRIRKFRGSLLQGWTVQLLEPETGKYFTIGVVPHFLDTFKLVDYREKQRVPNYLDHHLEPCS
jgi:hypothetical protein